MQVFITSSTLSVRADVFSTVSSQCPYRNTILPLSCTPTDLHSPSTSFKYLPLSSLLAYTALAEKTDDEVRNVLALRHDTINGEKLHFSTFPYFSVPRKTLYCMALVSSKRLPSCYEALPYSLLIQSPTIAAVLFSPVS